MNVNLVAEVDDLLSFGSDDECLRRFKIFAKQNQLFTRESANLNDLVFLFVKVFPLTFIRKLKKTRQWFVEESFRVFDPVSIEILKQFYCYLLEH